MKEFTFILGAIIDRICCIYARRNALEYYTYINIMEEDFEIAIKVVIVGNGGVGKSSMIQRYCKGIFTKDYKKTIGVDFLEKEIE